VPKNITAADEDYILKIFDESGIDMDMIRDYPKFSDEISMILNIQDAVFTRAPGNDMIPYGQPREPKNLYKLQSGYCSDRARTMDKAMRLAGFPSYYVSVYRNHPDYRAFQSFFITRATDYDCHSHAVIEVKTSKGWIVVDTRNRWISLSKENAPVNLQAMQVMDDVMAFPWSALNPDPPYRFFENPFYIVYGLYSRHGKFYRPYIPMLPNVNWGEMRKNIFWS